MRLIHVIVTVVVLAGARSSRVTLNVPQVLLPLVPSSGVRANFTLTADKGCFTWKSTKPHIASVHPQYGEGGCSRAAVVTPQSTSTSRSNTVVLAEQQDTGLVLRCDVYVDTIHRIEIVTTTRELLLDEAPEVFDVRAFDDEGNMFSSCRGHLFDWSLSPAGEQQPEDVISFVPFSESSYKADDIINSLESKLSSSDLRSYNVIPVLVSVQADGYHGDSILVSGIGTGVAIVNVKLMESLWKDVPSSSVKLLVLENLLLRPATDVYVTPFTVIHYSLERRKHGYSEVVTMPSSQYYYELTNETVGRLDHASSQVTALNIGYTNLVVDDKNTIEHLSGIKPSAGIHVVYPHHLGFSIAPSNSNNMWVLEVGRRYEITVRVYDKSNHEMIIAENMLLHTVIPSSHFIIHNSSSNHSYHHVTATSQGVVVATSTLSKLKNLVSGEEVVLPQHVTKQQNIEIYPPIEVTPSIMVLLWQPGVKYQGTLKATGGSGSYTWSSQLDSVATVKQGVVTMVTKGTTLVRATDVKNSLHYNESEVHVIPPDTLSFLPSVVEALVGHVISLPVKMGVHIDNKLYLFTDCRQAAVTITTTDYSIFNIKQDKNIELTNLPSDACMSLVAMATKPGYTQVTVRHKILDVQLETLVTVAAYPPLKPVDPEAIAVLSLGSSKVVTFAGGPSPWILDKTGYYEDAVTDNDEKVRIQHINTGQSSNHKYYVVCRKLGDQTLSVTVGNTPTKNNKFPANETSSVTISCDLPVTMTIVPAKPLPEDCMLLPATSLQPQVVPVYAGHQLVLKLTVFNDDGLMFDNFTSLKWNWQSSSPAHLSVKDHLIDLSHQGNHAMVTLSVGGQLGTVILSGSCDHHHHDYITEESITFKDPFHPGVNHSITLIIIIHHLIIPDYVVIFNHHDNQVTMAITGGSGYFNVKNRINNEAVARIQYDQENGTLLALPLKDGQVTIAIVDSCLPSSDEATAVLIVSDVYSIEVTMATKVKLEHTIIAVVMVMDCNGKPFNVDQLDHVMLLPHPYTSHITVKHLLPHPHVAIANRSVAFEVYGVTIGTTQLSFNITSRSGHVISSRSCDLEVYSDIKLIPPVMILLPGAIGQFTWSGGPSQVDVVFTISNVAIATINGTGLVEGIIPGNTTVTGRAQESDPITNDIVIFSEDTAVVQVVQLTGIKIWLPSSQLLEESEVSVRAHGINGETPFTFAGVAKQLIFHWAVSNMNIQSVSSVYAKGGVSLVKEGAPVARLRARQPGVGIIQVTMECIQGVCHPGLTQLHDEVTVTVLPRLRIVYPSNCGHLLLPCGGVAKIRTNRDGMSRISYKLLVPDNEFKPVTIATTGEVHAGSSVGHAVVMVTSHESSSGFNQSVMAYIEVQPIRSLSLTPLTLTQAPPTNQEYLFPLGYTVHFVINLHDNQGRTMANVPVDLEHRLHRNDIVDVSNRHGNNTLDIKTTKPGHVMLKVWLSGQPVISDYIHINVGYAIIPSLATVHVGSKVCFTMTTHLTEERPGEWSSGDNSVVAIDTLSGVAVAKTTGCTAIYHKIKDIVDTHTEVTVVKVRNVTIDNVNQLGVFTNVMTSHPYHVMLTFYHNDGPFTSLLATNPHSSCINHSTSHDQLSTASVYLQQVEFDCLLTVKSPTHPQISQLDVAKALAVFDSRSGKSYCHLMPTSNIATQRLLSTINDVTMTLQITAYDFDRSYTVSSALVMIPFVPSFVLSQQQIKLGSCDPIGKIEVWGTNDQLNSLQVSLDEDHTLIIAPPVFHSPTTTVYTISQQKQHEDHVMPDPSPKLDTVHFISTLTGQSSQLSVLSFSPSSDCASQSDQSVDDTVSAMPPSTLIPLLQQVTAVVGAELIVVMVTAIVVLLGSVAVCCSLWRHGNSGSTNQGGFSYHMSSASSTPRPLPPFLVSSPTTTPPGSSPRQPHQRSGSAFTPTNNSPHYSLNN